MNSSVMNTRFQLTKHDLYYAGLFLYVLSANIQYSYANNLWMASNSRMLTVLAVVRYAAYFLCLLHIISLGELNVTTIGLVSAFFLVVCYAVYTGSDKTPIFYFLVLVSAIRVDFSKCVKIFLIVQLVTCIVYFTLSMLGISGGETVVERGRIRSYLGYGWVNRASYCWFFICIELLYLKNTCFRFGESLFLFLISVYIYYKTKTSFSMMLTCGVLGYGMVSGCYHKSAKGKRIRTNHHILKRITVLYFIIAGLIGFVLIILYRSDSAFMNQLNLMLHDRLAAGKKAVDTYGLHLSGNKIQWAGSSTWLFGIHDSTEYFYVDSGFVQMSLEYGLLFTIFVFLMYLFSILNSYRLGDIRLLPCLWFLGFLFAFEPRVIDFGFNPFPLYFFSTMSLVEYRRRVIESIWEVERGTLLTSAVEFDLLR